MYHMLVNQEHPLHGACCGLRKEGLTNAQVERQVDYAAVLHGNGHDFIVDQAFLCWGVGARLAMWCFRPPW